MRTIALALLLTLGTAGPAAAAHHDDPPNRTGCCFSFDNSPVLICMTADACRFEGGGNPR